MNYLNHQKGFTIIETLVAIAVLMIAIVGPLTVVEQALNQANYSRDQMIASYLAQDAMESIRNIRDNNLLAGNSSGTSWLAGLSACTPTSLCGIETAPDPTFSGSPIFTCTSQQACPLYIDQQTSVNGGFYTSVPGSVGTLNLPTVFTRTFSITSPSNGLNDAAMVSVTVGWVSGTQTDQVNIQDMLFNVPR